MSDHTSEEKLEYWKNRCREKLSSKIRDLQELYSEIDWLLNQDYVIDKGVKQTVGNLRLQMTTLYANLGLLQLKEGKNDASKDTAKPTT